MTVSGRYATPTAFRSALTERLRAAARSGPWTLQQLQRQVAYDRLLERLYLVDDGWIVKGATALLARDLGVRASLDVDIYREAVREVAEAALRRAAASDLSDWFRFGVGVGTAIGNSAAPVCRSCSRRRSSGAKVRHIVSFSVRNGRVASSALNVRPTVSLLLSGTPR